MIGTFSKGTETAKACFQENITLFGSAKIDPEKYNLYNGLFHLAEALQQMEKRIQEIEKTLRPKK